MAYGLELNHNAKVRKKEQKMKSLYYIPYLFLFTIIAVGCGPLDPPQNGIVVLSGVSIGDTATYNCKHGFQLVGAGTRECQANGQWSGEAPTCSCRFHK